MDRALAVPGSGISRCRGGGVFWLPFYRENGPVECCMRWVPVGSFKHSNRELLALSICRDMTVLVVPKGPRGFPGVPEASLGRLRDVPGGPRGVDGRPRGVPRGHRGVPGRPRGVPWGPRSVPRGSPGSQESPGTFQASPGSFS